MQSYMLLFDKKKEKINPQKRECYSSVFQADETFPFSQK